MKFPRKLISCRFINRENRFSAMIEINQTRQIAHLPNSGRLTELLIPGREVFVLPASDSQDKRKTAYTLVLCKYGEIYVSLEAAKANCLFEEALLGGIITEFWGQQILAKEKRMGLSRVDFLLQDSCGIKTFLEVKSVTLVKNGIALFPDAATIRGRKHLAELINVNRKGDRGAIAFIIQRPDALCFSPNEEQDPEFARSLRLAKEEGIKIVAYKCNTGIEEICVTESVQVVI